MYFLSVVVYFVVSDSAIDSRKDSSLKCVKWNVKLY